MMSTALSHNEPGSARASTTTRSSKPTCEDEEIQFQDERWIRNTEGTARKLQQL
uniref:Uncharacterized protein n=1 Tax=Rhizophora mucronata TaxID=61149 RepID=A0A2P2IVX6_RHIMU